MDNTVLPVCILRLNLALQLLCERIRIRVHAQHIVGSKSKYFVCLPKFQNHVIERNFSGMIGH